MLKEKYPDLDSRLKLSKTKTKTCKSTTNEETKSTADNNANHKQINNA